MKTSEYAIRTDQLTRDFKTVRAVDQLTIEVPTGIVFGFLGPNGSGKTTTIRLLLGLLEASSGQAQVLGCDIRSEADEIRQRSGALLEYNGLYERMNAEDNLEFYGRIWRLPANKRRARIKELLNSVGLWDRRKEEVGGWSKGMKQKLAVVRTLLHRPELIFLDEPTAGLDPVAAAALREELEALAEREGVTVFLTTHNLAEAEKLCQQVGIIRSGKLLAVGRLDQLRTKAGGQRLDITGSGFTPAVLAALQARAEVDKIETHNGKLSIRLNQVVDTAPLINLLVSAGVQVEEVRKDKASLEEAFLTLVEEPEQT